MDIPLLQPASRRRLARLAHVPRLRQRGQPHPRLGIGPLTPAGWRLSQRRRPLVRLAAHRRAAGADEEVQVGAGVGAEHGLHVQLLPAPRRGRANAAVSGRATAPEVKFVVGYVDVEAPVRDVEG